MGYHGQWTMRRIDEKKPNLIAERSLSSYVIANRSGRISHSTPESSMPTYTLTDAANDLHVDHFELRARNIDPNAADSWSITNAHSARRASRGRRSDRDRQRRAQNRGGPDARNGDLERRRSRPSARLESARRRRPRQPGIRQPDELGRPGLARRVRRIARACGLGNNGAPYTEGSTTYGLHGKIANIPAITSRSTSPTRSRSLGMSTSHTCFPRK